MNKIRCAALLCALLTVSGTLAACGDTAGKPAQDTNAQNNQEKESETAAEEVVVSELEKLPEADYGGYVFNILHENQDDRHIDVMTAGEENGDVLNDVVFIRNRNVEEKYNIKIECTDTDFSAVTAAIQKEVSSGTNAHDMFFHNCYVMPVAAGGYLYDLTALENLNLANPWWDKAALNGLSIGGKVFVATGDISPTTLMTSSCLVFNKKLFANNDMEFPYQLAAEGKWTIDKLAEMTKGLTQDSNGDGKYTLGDDLFGFSSWMCDSPYSLFYGAGATLSEKDKDDVPYVSWNMDKISKVYEYMYQIIIDNNSYFVTDSGKYPTTYENFANGNAYICEITLQKIGMFLRDMEDDYGILPIPKFDEAQEAYMSCINGAGDYIVVPNNVSDPARTGMIVEAMSAGAYDVVTPSIYEVITKTKNVRDQESAEMVNLIIRNRVFDPFYINLTTGYSFAQDLLQKKSKEVSSSLEKKRASAEKAFKKIVDSYLEHEN